jgi:nucleoside-diphosphate-sugar epimerase
MQTILGANGTIASVLAGELPKYTKKIRLVSRNPRKVNEDDELFPADLSDPGSVDKAIAGSEVVYLMVGFDYNVKVWRDKWPKLMQATIAACIRHNAKLVFFDNVYPYAKTAIPHMTESSPVNPPSKKGEVRASIAGMLMDAISSGKLQGMIVRSADFYGPKNDKSFLIEVVYKNLRKGKAPNWFINADKVHSFTYTPDAAKATALLGNTTDAYNEVWHLPTDPVKLTGKELAKMFMDEMRVQKTMTVLPMWLVRAIGIFVPFMREMPEMMYQYSQDYFFDSSKFEKRFNLKATPYAEGIRNTILNS